MSAAAPSAESTPWVRPPASSSALANGSATSTSTSPDDTHILSAPYLIPGPTSPQSSLLASGQSYLLFPKLLLDNGTLLENAVLAYKTWGKLDPARKDNALVVAHALTGSADVEDWCVLCRSPSELDFEEKD